LEALAAAQDDAREEIVGFLEDCGPPTIAELPRIAHHLNSADGDAAYWAATLLGRSGPAAAAFLNDLVAATHHDSLAARERAVWALSQIGPAAKAALPRLKELSESTTPRLARLAREAAAQVAR
jgi:hypothetical protein